MKNTCRIASWLVILFLITFYGCKKERVPVLSTADVTNITTASAVSGGNITDEGSGTIISKGVCWNSVIHPTIENSKSYEGPGTGSFSSNISGLKAGTEYFVRAYATNSSGTGYGTELSFTTVDMATVEDGMIKEFINNNLSFPFQLKSSGLYYLDLLIGTGPAPATHDTAYVKYTGKFLDGTVFDSNDDIADTLIFPVNEGYLIAGFEEGITYMKEGGIALFLMPSKLAYGPEGYYIIPGYTPLLYRVALVKVKKK
jgi:hypothetical protein